MMEFNMNQFMEEVHQNAVEHGWWEEKRSDGTLRSLIHCELSEAVEADRRGEPLWWHKCPSNAKACEYQNVHEIDDLHCEVCEVARRKPEGAAVELMDAVIRILDWMGYMKAGMPEFAKWRMERALESIAADIENQKALVKNKSVADLVDVLHFQVVYSRVAQEFTDMMTLTIAKAMAWVYENGSEPVEILQEKHEYNKTRPYKHGKQF